jgi:hypothetical protein
MLIITNTIAWSIAHTSDSMELTELYRLNYFLRKEKSKGVATKASILNYSYSIKLLIITATFMRPLFISKNGSLYILFYILPL